MGVTDKLRELRWRAAGHYDRPLDEAYLAPLRGGRLLEIGGPSALFGAGGLLPVYPAAAAVDGVQWSDETLWHGRQRGPYAPDGIATGAVHITDGGTLEGIPDASYDGVISSHVIEHLANPLGALATWRRVTKPGGALLLVAPHKAGTFDHRRPVTSLDHLIADAAAGTGEDDLTHLEETLALHDRARDAETDDQEAWAALRRDNLRHRVLHHHVFTTPSLLALLDHAGIELLAAEARRPHDIYVIGRFAETPPGAQRLRVRSPFREDAAPPSASAPAGAR